MFFRKRSIQRCVAAGLMLLMADSARAQDLDLNPPAKAQTLQVDQIIYKGVVGNLLETVPLDPEQRVELQRANAVISNVLSGRTLAVLLGLANPVLMVGGLAWGIFAATRIKPAKRTPAARTAVVGVCSEEWQATAEAAAPVLASEPPPLLLRNDVAAAQP